jgi:hypothetical protein
VKPEPEVEAEFTVRGDVPEEVRVTDCVVEEFTVTLPKLSVGELTVSCGFDVVPDPLSDTTAVLPVVELLIIVRFPVADPVAAGLN